MRPLTTNRTSSSEGFDDIIVNGEVARRNGQFTTTLAGRVLRPERR